MGSVSQRGIYGKCISVRYLWGVYLSEVFMGSVSQRGIYGKCISVRYLWGVYVSEVCMGRLCCEAINDQISGVYPLGCMHRQVSPDLESWWQNTCL